MTSIDVTSVERSAGRDPGTFCYKLRLSDPVDQDRLMKLVMWGDLRAWGVVGGVEGRDSARTLVFHSRLELGDTQLRNLFGEFGRHTGYDFRLAA